MDQYCDYCSLFPNCDIIKYNCDHQCPCVECIVCSMCSNDCMDRLELLKVIYSDHDLSIKYQTVCLNILLKEGIFFNE